MNNRIDPVKAAKIIVKEIVNEIREKLKTSDVAKFNLLDSFSPRTSDRGYFLIFNRDWNREIAWAGDPNFIYAMCNTISRLVSERLHLPKKYIRLDENDTRWTGWSRHDYVKTIRVIKPCPAFFSLQKRLAKLGCKAIDPFEWGTHRISGKRDKVYFREERKLGALDPAVCTRVLEFLKGKKKISATLERDELSDREHGIEYETEWYGEEYMILVLTDAQGHRFRFF